MPAGNNSSPTLPAASPTPTTSAPTPAPAATPKANPIVQGENPCAHPELQTLELESGVVAKTPWQLELTYVADDDRKLGPGFVFMLHSGERRWETRRDSSNWQKPILWRGFCWRGAERPELRAKHVKVQVAPLCKDGQLTESGSCTPAFKQ